MDEITKIVNQTLTTHVAILLDRSVSMSHLRDKMVQVADELVAYLAEQSTEMGQEWKTSVYTFGSDVSCHIWNMDVLRLPSMKEYYRIDGNTALVDAVMMALDDGDTIPERHGNHAHLVYVLTDGEENWSKGSGPKPIYGRVPTSTVAQQLTQRIKGLAINRTVAVLAPNDKGVAHVQKLGFQNIALWDTSTEAGLEAAVQTIKDSATNYMRTRTGTVDDLRRTKTSLFVGGNVDAAAIKAADLKPLPTDKRKIVVVVKTEDSFEKVVLPANTKRKDPVMGSFVKIEDYVKRINKGIYPLGDVLYELTKGETLTGDKEIAVVDVNTNQVYVGDGARQLLGLTTQKCRVKPGQNAQYKIFFQSNSLNRHLPHGCSVMVLDR